MREIFEKLILVEDPIKRRALFIAFLSREISRRGGSSPIVVGGEALELYTQGSYTTGDIDLKSPAEITGAVLKDWGFTRKTRTWFNKELDIYVDWLGTALDEGPEAEKRVTVVKVAEGLEIRVISIEDLIIDRLNAAKWWKDEDSLMWVKVLLRIKEMFGEDPDLGYLRNRAQAEDILDYLSLALGPALPEEGVSQA